MTLVFAAHLPRCATIRALPRKQTRRTGSAVRVMCAGTVQVEQAQGLSADAGLRRQVVEAALSLKQRGWAVVDDVLPQCAPQTCVCELVQLRRSALRRQCANARGLWVVPA